MFCLELWYPGEKYSSVLDAAIQLSAFENKIFPNKIMTWHVKQEIYISSLELQRWSLEFINSISKVYICDRDWG